MLILANCKINLGLNVVEKRPDGFHNIETVFYPLGWSDALEVLENPNAKNKIELSFSGIPITGDEQDNLIYKAWRLISEKKDLPPMKVHLHKNIPMGAGLGGGSSDAAHFIQLLDSKFSLGFSEPEKIGLCSSLGSDCAFFIGNKPLYAQGKGNELSDIKVDLSTYYILVVFPGLHSNTKDAYSALVPGKPPRNVKSIVEGHPVEEWKDLLVNDFEHFLFEKYHEAELLKEGLYHAGALYASLSGSGSSVFGIFKRKPPMVFPDAYKYFLQKPTPKIL